MKSIQTKIITLVLCCVFISTIAVVGMGVMNAKNTLEKDSVQIMNLLCDKQAQQLDTVLKDIEQSVNTIYHVAMEDVKTQDNMWQQEKELDAHVRKVKEIAGNVAENTEGAVVVYYRFNRDVAEPMQEIYMKKNGDTFLDYHISEEESGEMTKEIWYQQTVENRKPTWIAPYQNTYINKEVISYCIPVMSENTVIGVIGMDIDIDLLRENVSAVQIYDSGYAFLMDSEGNMVYHKNYPQGLKLDSFEGNFKKLQEKFAAADQMEGAYTYQWGDVPKRMVVRKCTNEMYIAICVPEQEIEKPKQQFLLRSVIALYIALCVSVLVTARLTKMIVGPLKELNRAAQKIAGGDLEVSIECKTKDEVGELAESFRKTAKSLKKHIEHINRLAYTDMLTGTLNKTAYTQKVEQIDAQIQEGSQQFAVVVMDINNLKKVNDNLGHEMGDRMIQDASHIMKKVFAQDSIYRIGGDEFAVILTQEQYFIGKELVEKFKKELRAFNDSQKTEYQVGLQIALGLTTFDEKQDKSFADVFRRSDSFMYENKKAQKNGQ